MSRRITPRTLKGFTDELPDRALRKERCVDRAKAVFRRYGFSPIETPSLEYAEILLGKIDPGAEIDRQIYRFRDQGDRDVALRFDLTVPLARFVAQHSQELGMPFKRYHVGTVWRGENPQAGRRREFTQCDIDTIGTTSPVADAEMLAVTCDLLRALDVERFVIKLNDRRILSAALAKIGVDRDLPAVLRAVDKLSKIGSEGVARELVASGLSPAAADAVLALCSTQGPAAKVLDGLGTEADGLRAVVGAAVGLGASEQRIVVDLSIARGLDYYTGMVFETFLEDLPSIGSVCSGGRYDDLAGLYTSQSLPGVGASLGLTRLLDAWEELGIGGDEAHTPSDVLVVRFPGETESALRVAAILRSHSVATELYPDERRVSDQLRYAQRRGHRLALLCGPDERQAGVVTIKHLRERTESTATVEELAAAVKGALARPS